MDAYCAHRAEFVALCPEKYPAEYIDAQILSRNWLCWGDERAAILAEVKTYPSGLREIHGLAAAGDLTEIQNLIPLAEQYGEHIGCKIASIESREGWARLLPDYEVEQVRIVKELV